MPGTITSEVEVTNISKHGFWILIDERELLLPREPEGSIPMDEGESGNR